MIFRLTAAVSLLALSGVAQAQVSQCAGIPPTQQVTLESITYTVLKIRKNGQWVCPSGTNSVSAWRCQGTRPSRTANAQQHCYADLPLGPVRGPARLRRPPQSCPNPGFTGRYTHHVALTGRNIALDDAAMTVSPGATVTPLNPATFQNQPITCGPANCRLLKVVLENEATTSVTFGFAFPGRPQTTWTISTPQECPAPIFISENPPRGCTSAAPCP